MLKQKKVENLYLLTQKTALQPTVYPLNINKKMPFKTTTSGLTINIRLSPNAQKNKILGTHEIENNKKALKVAINAIPEDGKANKALITFLAKTWKIPKSSISLISGHTNKNKILFIEGDGETLKNKILATSF